MNGPIAVLSQEDLIDVGIHEIGLAEMGVEGNGHGRLAHLAYRRTPRVEKVILDELLSQSAAALLDLTRAQIGPHRARDPEGIDTVMTVKIAVLDSRQRGREQRRHLLWRDDDPIFTVGGKYAANQLRLEAENGDILARAVVQRLDAFRIDADCQNGCRTRFVHKSGGS